MDKNLNVIDRAILFVERKYYYCLVLLLMIASFNLFFKLDTLLIEDWDEARHGISAYEMLKSGNYIVNTYNNQFDYWNLKPPLSFWMVMLGYKIAGFTPLGLRIISAVTALLTILMIGLFVKYKHNNISSLISVIILMTSAQYLLHHGARTGDADSLFVFLFTAAVLALLLSDKSLNWIYISGLAFSLAFLTKSWHAGSILVIIGAYLISTGKFLKIRSIQWVLLAGIIVVPILIWITLRYRYDGWTFFNNMLQYDLINRTTSVLEQHLQGQLFYLRMLLKYHFLWIVLLLWCGFQYITFFKKRLDWKIYKQSYILGLALWGVIPLVLLSISKTKLFWYIYPIYPFFSVLLGIMAGFIIMSGQHHLRKIIVILGVFVCLIGNEAFILHKIVISDFDTRRNVHILLKEISQNEYYRGYHIYSSRGSYSSTKGDWPQGQLLTVKLYDQLIPEDGGLGPFLQDKKALLLLLKDDQAFSTISSYHLKPVSEDQQYYILAQDQ